MRLRWEPEMLSKIGLPKFEYPVPKKNLEWIMAIGHIRFSDMLYWLQGYSEDFVDDWLKCETVMLSLFKLLVTEDEPVKTTVEGNYWRVFLGSVDLAKEIITIQRSGHLLAALQNDENGRLVVSAYHPLDAKSVRLLQGLFTKPAPDGTVCIRANNWEYARDQSVSIGNAYAAERNDAYLSYWKGLGINYDGSIINEWHSQRDLEPIKAGYIAIQIQLKSPMQETNE